MSDLRFALAEEACWKCGSWGHWATNCPRYMTEEDLDRRWLLVFGTERRKPKS